jgi:uncharacterized membrane protein
VISAPPTPAAAAPQFPAREVTPARPAPAPSPSPGLPDNLDPDEHALTTPVDWERWLGVRGAAVLGAVVMAIAGIMFFRYAIEHSLIAPPVRVALAVLAGIACLVSGERLRERYTPTANGLSAAGVVVLYAAFWACHARYELVPLVVAFVLMALTTVVCALLSVRYGSQLIAVLGICGGFATPLLLSTGSNRPIGLFSYVLLLDVGFLYVARRRGWTLLASLLLACTAVMQLLWIWKKMETHQLPIALGVLGVFALLFVWVGARAEGAERERWFPAQIGAVLLPFMFVQHFAAQTELGPHLYPIALLLALLLGAAGYVSERQGNHTLALASAAGAAAVVARYAFPRVLDAALTWELALCVAALAAVPHIFVERQRLSSDWAGPAGPALVAQLGLFAVYTLTMLAGDGIPLAAAAAGWVLLTLLLLAHGRLSERSWLYPVAASALALALAMFEAQQAYRSDSFAWLRSTGGTGGAGITFMLALNTLVCVAFQGLPWVPWLSLAAAHRRRAELAALIVPLVFVLFAPSWFELRAAPAFAVGLTFGWAYLSVLIATRMGSGLVHALTTAVLAFVHTIWSLQYASASGASGLGLLLQALCVLFFMLWPTLQTARFQSERLAWYAAALAGPLWFFSLRALWLETFGKAAIGALPVLLAAASLGVFARVQKLLPADDPRRLDTLAWLAAVALGFVSVAIPLQLDRQWITLGWAIQGFAIIVLWTRLDHVGLKYFALALLFAVFVRLVFNQYVLGYEPRGSMRIVNWLMYTYWVPVAALLGASRLLSRHEVSRLRAWEDFGDRAIGAAVTGFGAVVLFFVWINLAIADWFSTGDVVTLRFEHSPARDLTTSLAWACYAIVLLAAGMWRGQSALRWLSLSFLVLTIGKVFLYDLGHLQDLYRVVSLVGLALSLIGVSLAYQRFVFRRRVQEGRES